MYFKRSPIHISIIIIRDLKPSNILYADDSGNPDTIRWIFILSIPLQILSFFYLCSILQNLWFWVCQAAPVRRGGDDEEEGSSSWMADHTTTPWMIMTSCWSTRTASLSQGSLRRRWGSRWPRPVELSCLAEARKQSGCLWTGFSWTARWKIIHPGCSP